MSCPLLPLFVTVSTLCGVVVPMPTFLLESTISPLPATVRSEEKRLVEDAVVEKELVVVAFVVVEKEEVKLGNMELVLVVAVKYEPSMLLPRMSPATESF